MGLNTRQGNIDRLCIGKNAFLIVSRLKKPFAPPTVTLKEIHDAVPKHLLKSTPLLLPSCYSKRITNIPPFFSPLVYRRGRDQGLSLCRPRYLLCPLLVQVRLFHHALGGGELWRICYRGVAEDVAQSFNVVRLLVVPGTRWCWYFLSRYVFPSSRRGQREEG